MRISVVLPTHLRNDVLALTLEAYQRQTLPRERFEVVVVEDGPPGHAEAVTRAAGFRYLDAPHAPGPAGARNLGAAAAVAELILFAGDDMVPAPDLLERHLWAHEAEPGGAVLGHVRWHPDCGITPFMRHVVERGGQFSFHSIADPERCSYRFFYTSNLSLAASWLRLERFDESFSGATTEDVELGYRLARRGLVIRYRPEALVLHHHHLEERSYCQRMERAGEAVARFVTKHAQDPDPRRRLLPFSVVPGGARAVSLGGRLLGLLPPGRLRWYGLVIGHYARGAAREEARLRRG